MTSLTIGKDNCWNRIEDQCRRIKFLLLSLKEGITKECEETLKFFHTTLIIQMQILNINSLWIFEKISTINSDNKLQLLKISCTCHLNCIINKINNGLLKIPSKIKLKNSKANENAMKIINERKYSNFDQRQGNVNEANNPLVYSPSRATPTAGLPPRSQKNSNKNLINRRVSVANNEELFPQIQKDPLTLDEPQVKATFRMSVHRSRRPQKSIDVQESHNTQKENEVIIRDHSLTSDEVNNLYKSLVREEEEYLAGNDLKYDRYTFSGSKSKNPLKETYDEIVSEIKQLIDYCGNSAKLEEIISNYRKKEDKIESRARPWKHNNFKFNKNRDNRRFMRAISILSGANIRKALMKNKSKIFESLSKHSEFNKNQKLQIIQL